MDDAREIARRLSEAQENALFFPNGYLDPNTVKALRRKGLMRGSSLTPLGLQVRQVLQERQDGMAAD